MNTLNAKTLPEYVKVIHVAFGCGCVRTFHVEHQSKETRCVSHGDPQISFTEEYRPRGQAA